MSRYIQGQGPLQPRLVIVGEWPGRSEEEYGIPFVGTSGEILDELLESAGIHREECYFTYVVKYQPPKNDPKLLHHIGVSLNEQIENFKTEMRGLNANCILALGEFALLTLTGKKNIYNYRGSILKSDFCNSKVVATLHPQNFLFQFGRKSDVKGVFKYSYRFLMQLDIQRAVEEARTPDLNLPYRDICVARTSLDLFRFLKRYENDDFPAVDIESLNCIPVCMGIAFNPYEAISVPLWRNLSFTIKRGKKTDKNKFQISQMSDAEIVECWRLLAEFLYRKRIIGQNFKYDDDKTRRLGLATRKLYADTLLLEHTLNPELPKKGLQMLTSFRTRQPYYKDEGKDFNPKYDNFDQLFKYNGMDCCVTKEIHIDQDKELDEIAELYNIPNFRSFFYDYVMGLHNFYLDIDSVGFRVDYEKRKELRTKYHNWHVRLQDEFVELLGHKVNAFSPKQLATLLYSELRLPVRKDTSEDTIVALLANVVKDDKRKRILSNILEDRRVRKSLSTYILARPDYDGRIRTSYRISGTETGRSSTNILQKPIRLEKMGMAFQTITKHGDIGQDIREEFITDEGFVFLQTDLSQAEARVVAVLAEDYELLSAFDRIDVHRRTAGLVFGLTVGIELGDVCSNKEVDLLGKDSSERFIGKKTRHAGNYNMKKHTFMVAVQTDARRFKISIDFSEWKAGQSLDKFHAASPRIRQVFHRDIIEAIDRTRVLVNPFGRFRMFLGRPGEEMYLEAFANIPQSTVHDSLTQAGLRIKKQIPDIRIVMECHDSFLFLLPINEWKDQAKLIKKEMEVPIDFSNGSLKRNKSIVIPVDLEYSETNYKELSKVKL